MFVHAFVVACGVYAVVACGDVNRAAAYFNVCALDSFVSAVHGDFAAVDFHKFVGVDSVVEGGQVKCAAFYKHVSRVRMDRVVGRIDFHACAVNDDKVIRFFCDGVFRAVDFVFDFAALDAFRALNHRVSRALACYVVDLFIGIAAFDISEIILGKVVCRHAFFAVTHKGCGGFNIHASARDIYERVRLNSVARNTCENLATFKRNVSFVQSKLLRFIVTFRI